MASPTCLRLLAHRIRSAAALTFWTAGNSRPISTAMMARTTSSSTSVKARRGDRVRMVSHSFLGRRTARRIANGCGSGERPAAAAKRLDGNLSLRHLKATALLILCLKLNEQGQDSGAWGDWQGGKIENSTFLGTVPTPDDTGS